MESNELATFNQAIKYAQGGYNEKAFEFIKMLAQREPDNINLIFWGMYTAPNFEWAQSLFERAKLVDPGHGALAQAEQWLINEKLRLPHPAIGYSLFPPNINTVQIGTNSNPHYATHSQPAYWTQPVQVQYPPTQTQYLTPPPVQMQYQAPQPQFYPQPAPVMPQQIYIQNGPVYAYRCRYCHSYLPPLTGRRTSTGGWITFAILLVFFFPLCWIGFLFKQNYRVCGQCGIRAD